MAIILRGDKGSALSHHELDNNFRHFTGSHAVTGSLEVSGSIVLTGSLMVSGSNTLENVGTFKNTGLATLQSILPNTDALNVSGSTTLTGSLITSGSVLFTGLPTADPGVAGNLWVDASAGYVLKVSQ